MRHTLRTLLRPANLARGIAILIALALGVAIFASPDLRAGDASLDPTSAAASTLDDDAQRATMRTLGTQLCEPANADQRARELELRAQLAGSLDAEDVVGFWERAVRGKTVRQIEAAFFGCESLTRWMHNRALAEDVDVAAIIEAEIGGPM